MNGWRIAALLLIIGALPAAALDLRAPEGAEKLRDHRAAFDSYALPLGTFAKGQVATTRLEGAVRRQSWRLLTDRQSSLETMAPLRDALRAAGYRIVLDCDGPACGGFDFRFAIEVIPAPDMDVNLRDYRFVAARRGPQEAASLLVSKSRTETYVQLITVRAAGKAEAPARAAARTAEQTGEPQAQETAGPSPEEGADRPEAVQGFADIGAQLTQKGFAVLDDLVFASGSAELGPGPFASLQALADFIRSAAPGTRVAIVGHTDSVGGLAANTALSRRRAEAVKQRMVTRFALSAARMQAEGIGYLSPVASNETPEGRERNRRVEAVILPE